MNYLDESADHQVETTDLLGKLIVQLMTSYNGSFFNLKY